MADEYIRKADAIKQCGFGMTSLHIADNLRKMPPADVVPVVRCGQCRYCTNNWHSSVYDECGRTGAYVSEDDYCSKGEKDDTQRIL